MNFGRLLILIVLVIGGFLILEKFQKPKTDLRPVEPHVINETDLRPVEPPVIPGRVIPETDPPRALNSYKETHDVLSHDKSLNWLSENGYTVSGNSLTGKISNGGISYNIDTQLGGTILGKEIPDSSALSFVKLMYIKGKIYIAIPKQ